MAHIHQLLTLISIVLQAVTAVREQSENQVQNIVSGEPVTFPCSMPGFDALLKWKFRANGSTPFVDAAQVFPGGIATVFNQFDTPSGRSEIIYGQLKINEVRLPDEGHFYCEISSVNSPAVVSDLFPLHVWVKPLDPQLTPLGNGTVLENEEASVAICSSTGGKPGAKLTWMNGTTPIVSDMVQATSMNALNDKLWDTSLYLKLMKPTRFDHQRQFHCKVEHPAYKEAPMYLNHSVNVAYHPVNIRVWANITVVQSSVIYCEADGFPAPKYNWIIPGNKEATDSPSLVEDLNSMNPNDFFECEAYNTVAPSAFKKVLVEDLLYPNGRPGFLGMAYTTWAMIGGCALAFIIVLIVIICMCCKKRNKKEKNSNRPSRYTTPIVTTSSGLKNSQPSLLEFDSMRTPDGRESSQPPSESNYRTSNMKKAYSLERLVEDKYGDDHHQQRSGVSIVPTHKLDREYRDNSAQRRASREEIDQVADHIALLNKSWDHLARSRENLSRSREELHVEMPPRYQSHEDINNYDDDQDEYQQQHGDYYRGSTEVQQHNEDSYPYMDDTIDNRTPAVGQSSSTTVVGPPPVQPPKPVYYKRLSGYEDYQKDRATRSGGNNKYYSQQQDNHQGGSGYNNSRHNNDYNNSYPQQQQEGGGYQYDSDEFDDDQQQQQHYDQYDSGEREPPVGQSHQVYL